MNKTVSKGTFLWRVATHPMASLRQLRNWQLIEDKIAFWKTNEKKIELWMDHERVVTKAVNDHLQLQQEERYRKFEKDFDTFRTLSSKTVTRFALGRDDVLLCFDDMHARNRAE